MAGWLQRQHKLLMLLAGTLIGASLSACVLTEENGLPLEYNNPPEAALRAPVIAPADKEVKLDASASSDPDGDKLSYYFEFNDGSPSLASTDPIVYHLFSAPGLYTIRVHVSDILGQEAIASQDIAVRIEYPEPPDFCEKTTDCVVGDECAEGVCYATGGSVQ